MPDLRERQLTRLGEGLYDVLIVGGGINGAVSAAALAGQGARVALIDRGDFAGMTSQASSNLVWGGIKYLESREFALVRELCLSRNRLLRHYPSWVREVRFLATIDRGFRWDPRLLWLGTWVYWLFGSGFTRIPKRLSRRAIARAEPRVDTAGASGGFEYSDAFLSDHDARFVFQFVRGALRDGCAAANYVESLGARRDGGVWTLHARDVETGREREIRARVLVNAAGPLADAHNALSGVRTEHHHVFSKGVHLIVPQLSASGRILTFFGDDGRLFFVIPMGSRSCVGTTDTPVEHPDTRVTDADRRFLLDNVNRRLKLSRPLAPADVIAERCGVRPLAVRGNASLAAGDWLQLSRRHVIEVDRERAHLSLFGGKLTDCLNVAEEVADRVQELGVALPMCGRRWYGEPDAAAHEAFLDAARALQLDAYTPSGAHEPLSQRLWRRYDRDAMELLAMIRADARAAEIVIEGTEYLRCELALAREHEMIVRLEDFLRRRSRIAQIVGQTALRDAPGLIEACRILFGDDAQRRFEQYFADPAAGQPPPDSGAR
ncbi:Aerobic glycerol-3-phosphate dehydrogenase [Thioalkalivibrio nitratireducens DSM 14787]|uniref:Aerobic glycerol-3-phosphate dehydrogenase n=1 Tax=Thioalkalivibrio nitratireducens (strain DSM 14787 / UNIQEM 213 / ALEN2) TaxID=1255043 RepID=L0DYX9_THIND|nr:glycerol-3-phosphate dehydrogenase/oxidase [Thioalkalivibrio nitratireducens]AGA34170.1 Aerobic glycerol-3-phosphate dehydrogenase [Thioalkalivibrio nitratireducens DSM 14787]